MKKKLLLITPVMLLATIGVATALSNPEPTKATDSPLVQQVDNHEARITNTENDVEDLQTKTNTPPSTTRVNVPSVTTSVSTPTEPTVPPPSVLVVAYEKIPVNDTDIDCQLTYSDGTTYKWHWKTYNQINNSCNNDWIGTQKN